MKEKHLRFLAAPLLGSILVLASMPAATAAESTGYKVPPAFTPLPLGTVKPAGWLRDWCQDAADGITGHADELDPFFKMGWLDLQEGWDSGFGTQAGRTQTGDKKLGYALEQAGYWIDGAVRLGYLLDDKALLAKCQIRFDAILGRVEAGQPPMNVNTDMWKNGQKWGHWPMAIMGRALLAQYSATGEARYLRALEKIYADYPRFNAGGKTFSLITHQGRQVTNVEVMFEAFRLGGDVRLRDDAISVLRSQSGEITERLGWHLQDIAQGKTDPHFYEINHGHAVTFNESAKLPAIGYLYTGEPDWLRFSESSAADMEKNEMLPYGLTSAHEQPGGIGSLAVTELCNAIDYSWSNLWLLRITGNPAYGDRIERALFNAAPGAIAPDFKTHAYFLSPNRIDEKHPDKPKVGGTSAFLPKHFPLCCTGNVSRLLPNYVMHLWMASGDGGLAAVLYGPSDTKTRLGGTGVALATRTDYPFGDDIIVTVNPERPATFPLHLRVPAWCAAPEVTVNGRKETFQAEKGFIRLGRTWNPGDTVRLSLPRQPRIDTGTCANGAPYASVHYGPLLFALQIPNQAGDLNTPKPGAEWQFALLPESAGRIQVTRQPMPKRWSWGAVPPLLQLTVPAMPAAYGANLDLPAQAVPAETGKMQTLSLVPFGATAFRVSMFAIVKAAGETKSSK